MTLRVIGICGQELQITDLERFAAALGPDGDDPFIASIAGHQRLLWRITIGERRATPLAAQI
jgi:hypothetical protein